MKPTTKPTIAASTSSSKESRPSTPPISKDKIQASPEANMSNSAEENAAQFPVFKVFPDSRIRPGTILDFFRSTPSENAEREAERAATHTADSQPVQCHLRALRDVIPADTMQSARQQGLKQTDTIFVAARIRIRDLEEETENFVDDMRQVARWVDERERVSRRVAREMTVLRRMLEASRLKKADMVSCIAKLEGEQEVFRVKLECAERELEVAKWENAALSMQMGGSNGEGGTSRENSRVLECTVRDLKNLQTVVEKYRVARGKTLSCMDKLGGEKEVFRVKLECTEKDLERTREENAVLWIEIRDPEGGRRYALGEG